MPRSRKSSRKGRKRSDSRCRGPAGGADVNTAWGTVRQETDPTYLVLNGDALTGLGVSATVTIAQDLAPVTYVASESSNTIDVSASIGGDLLAARVNLVVIVLTAAGVELARTQALAMFAPFSTQTQVALKIEAGNLVRVLADGTGLAADVFTGIAVILRQYSLFEESDGEDECC